MPQKILRKSSLLIKMQTYRLNRFIQSRFHSWILKILQSKLKLAEHKQFKTAKKPLSLC